MMPPFGQRADRSGADGRPLRAVALGGGHGLQATLRALRRLTDDITAVVTVADDGGSSGRLRQELGLLPPGDLRKALAALAPYDDSGTMWQQVFEHRFGGTGALAGHAVGNLVLTGLLEVLDDPVQVLAEAGRLLRLHGTVLPMSTRPLDIEADVAGLNEPGQLHTIRGQVAVATTPGQVRRVRLAPTDPPACPQAVQAVHDADLVVLGPGSWFSSVLPHLLVPELLQAICDTTAVRVVVLNLVPQPGETPGFSPERHLHVLSEHAARLRVDSVIAGQRAVPVPDRLRGAAAELGAQTVLADVSEGEQADRHDPQALATALATTLGSQAGAGVTETSMEDRRWR